MEKENTPKPKMKKYPISAYLGEGETAMHLTILVTEDELEMMDQIRKESPDNENMSTVDLIQEARARLNIKPFIVYDRPSNNRDNSDEPLYLSVGTPRQ